MRLFRRRNDDATPDPEGPASVAPAPTSGANADDGVARAPRQPTGDWMTLPPLAPSFPAMPTTFRVQTLPEILTSHTDTRLSGSLGHAVSADAPSGSIGNLTSPAASMSHAGDVSHGSAMGELPLREPHHAPAPPEPPLEVRRLADPAPMAASSPSLAAPPDTPSLPEPAVSRSLLDTAPLAARPTWDRPLPLARVIDAPAAASAPAPPAAVTTGAPSSLSSEPEPPDEAPLVGDDDRVGGFGVGSDDPFTSDVDDVPRSAAPPELAPPIQPRRIQRRLDAAAPTAAPASAPASTPTDRPLVQRAASEASASAAPAAPLTGALPAVDASPAVPEPAPAPPTRSGDLPLVAPSASGPVEPRIQRVADTAPSTSPTTTGRGPDAAATASSDTGSPEAASSAATDAATAGPSTPTPATEDRTPADPATVSTLGAAPMVDVQTLAEGTSPAATDAPSATGELPLVSRVAAASPAALPSHDLPSAATSAATASDGGASGGDDLATPRSSDEGTPAGGDLSQADPPTVSTLGSSPLVQLQPMAEGAGSTTPAPSPGTAGLPLAPSDLGGTLQPPAPRTAPAEVQRQPEASSVSRPLAAPSPPTAAAGAPSLQRLASPTAPATSTGPLPFVRPITAASSNLGLQRSTATTAPMATLATPSAPTSGAAASSDLPVQLRRLGAPDLGDAVTAESLARSSAPHLSVGPLPLAGVQRLDATTSSTMASATAPSTAATSNGASAVDAAPARAELPLHTPAASIPTATDVAVRAGLAERGPDGSVFTTVPLQRSADGQLGNGIGGVPVQRALGGLMGAIGEAREHVEGGAASVASAAGAVSSAASSVRGIVAGVAGGGGAGGGDQSDPAADQKSLAAQAKKLYPFIRSALEADMRRQIEGKSRASRYRP